MTDSLKENEIVEELENGVKIIVNTDLYRYTSDSVRLAKSVSASAGDRILDICCGGGVIPLLLASYVTSYIDGVELQYPLYETAKRSVALNDLNDRIRLYHCDIKEFQPTKLYDAVTCNPPYYKIEQGTARQRFTADVARHELACTLVDIADAIDRNLKFGGKAYIVHKCERMSEVFTALTERKIEPKEVVIYGNPNKNCDTFVVTAKKGAKPGLIVKYSML